MIAACRARLPEVDFSLKEMVSGDQLEALASGQIDAGLLRPPIARPELASKRVVAEPLLAAIPRKHPLASSETISIKDFDGQPFVMYSPYESRYFHDLLVAQFTRADILPRYVQHLSQIHSILAMVRAGLGLAIVPAAAASLEDRRCQAAAAQAARPRGRSSCSWSGGATIENPLLPSLVEIAGEVGASKSRRMIDADRASVDAVIGLDAHRRFFYRRRVRTQKPSASFTETSRGVAP